MFSQYLIITKRSPQLNQVIASRVKAALASQHLSANLQVSRYRENTNLLVKRDLQIAYSGSVILVVGTDNFLNEVLNATEKLVRHGRRIPISYIPTRAGSYFANRYHLPLDWRRGLTQIISHAHSQSLKVGYFDENVKKKRRYFLTDVGIGYNRNLIKECQRHQPVHKQLKIMGTIVALIYNLQSFPLIIRQKYQKKPTQIKPVFMISVSLTHKGLLRLTVVRKKNVCLTVLPFITWLLNRRFKLKRVLTYVTKPSFRIETSALEYGSTDNEEIGSHYYDLSFHVTNYPFVM